tara:strand:- start:14 stop:376 length:363 start_codon:yes stop_codon:yes gene_type:complete
MKNLLFVLAFTFIGGQAFSQMYIVTISDFTGSHPSNCYEQLDISSTNSVMTTVDPQGNITYVCLPKTGSTYYNGNNIALLNIEFNSILNQGYKLVSIDTDNDISINGSVIMNGAWYFAIP